MKFFTKKITLTAVAVLMLGGISFAQNYLWGGPGDPNGEFDGGLNDWTVNAIVQPDAVWVWEEDADVSEGAFAPAAPINSPSAANGCAAFDSDFYDNGGLGIPNLGMGPAPAPHNCELVSPIIDLTDFDKISIEFYNYYRRFDSETLLIWSNDGGMTWGDTIEVNPELDIRTNGPSENNRRVIHLLGAGGTDQFQFKFAFVGDYYFWAIDDVGVIERPDTDLELGFFFYPPASYQTPRSQIATDSMGFWAQVSNFGKETVENVVVTAEVLDGNDVLYSDQVEVGALASETIDSFIEFTELYAPEGLANGNYDIRYTLTSDGDEFTPGNNTDGDDFRVHSSVYSKEDNNALDASQGINYEVGFQPNGGGEFGIGNLYITSSDWLTDQYVMTRATFAMAYNQGTPIENVDVFLYLLEVDDDEVAPDFSDFDVSETSIFGHPQTILRGLGIHTFTNEDSFDRVNVSLEDDEFDIEEGVLLEPGKRYFLFVDYTGDAQQYFHVFNQRRLYWQNSTVFANSDGWDLGGFGAANAGLTRMQIDMYTTADEIELPEESITFFPNPTADQLTVNVQLDEPSLVNVVIADIDGQIHQIDTARDVTTLQRSYDVSDLAPGTYLVRLATEEGTRTKKFVVAK